MKLHYSEQLTSKIFMNCMSMKFSCLSNFITYCFNFVLIGSMRLCFINSQFLFMVSLISIYEGMILERIVWFFTVFILLWITRMLAFLLLNSSFTVYFDSIDCTGLCFGGLDTWTFSIDNFLFQNLKSLVYIDNHF